MGQKVNPISLRLEKTNRHFDSCWYDDYNYTDLLLRDLKIKNYFKSVLNQIKYPEGRILIENLPKKSNINYFYCNPSNSRRKKNTLFQLQDKVQKDQYKDNKKSVSSFFTFPEQKYWNQEKSNTFTLAQQGLEGWTNSLTRSLYLYKKNVPCDGNKVEKGLKKQKKVLHKNRLFECLSDLIQTKKIVDKIDTEKRILPKANFTDQQVGKELLLQENKKIKEYSKIKEIIDKKIHYRHSLYPNKDFSFFFRQNKHNPSEISLKEECGKLSFFFQQRVYLPNAECPVEAKKHKGITSRLLFQQEQGSNSMRLGTTAAHKKEERLREQLAQPGCARSLSLLLPGRGLLTLLGHNNINNFLLQFVLKKRENNKIVENQDTDKKWVVKRFFVRYLLSRLYGEFLQNKSVYSQENLLKSSIYTTLYQFRMFFQEKNKKQSIEERDYKNPSSKKFSMHSQKAQKALCGGRENKLRIPLYQIEDLIEPFLKHLELSSKQGIGKGVQREDNEPKSLTKYNKFFGSKKNKMKGLYTSNLVYKSHLESFLSTQYNSFFNLHLFRTLIEMQGALFLVQEIIYYLERKIPFRRIKTQILKEIPRYKQIKGVRMSCSGRVGGRSKKAQRSKTQSVKIGQTPLGVFSSQIDFASKSALTRFGLIGVKVWVCYR